MSLAGSLWGVISLYWFEGSIQQSDENQLWQLQFCACRLTIAGNDKPNASNLWFAVDIVAALGYKSFHSQEKWQRAVDIVAALG